MNKILLMIAAISGLTAASSSSSSSNEIVSAEINANAFQIAFNDFKGVRNTIKEQLLLQGVTLKDTEDTYYTDIFNNKMDDSAKNVFAKFVIENPDFFTKETGLLPQVTQKEKDEYVDELIHGLALDGLQLDQKTFDKMNSQANKLLLNFVLKSKYAIFNFTILMNKVALLFRDTKKQVDGDQMKLILDAIKNKHFSRPGFINVK